MNCVVLNFSCKHLNTFVSEYSNPLFPMNASPSCNALIDRQLQLINNALTLGRRHKTTRTSLFNLVSVEIISTNWRSSWVFLANCSATALTT